MDSHVGSGRIITAPIITEDGEPIQDPLVLLEANPDQVNSNDSVSSSNETRENRESSGGHVQLDRQVIDWKLTLHQIGKHQG